jgi:hypothetical protein
VGWDEFTQKVSYIVHQEKEGNTVDWVIVLFYCGKDNKVG